MAFAFPQGSFERIDESDDGQFYDQPRLVYHIDEYAVRAVGETYRRFLEPGGEFLDLMSSWVSHFPADFPIGRLVGHGMNEEELRANRRLSEYFLQDLNKDPKLPGDDASFDGVTICVSVQYLTRPVEVFAEIARVLRPSKPLIVTYSNRCFPTKAVRIWRDLGDEDHGRLVALYAEQAGGFEPARLYDLSPRRTTLGLPDDEQFRERVRTGEVYTDPLYAVVAYRAAGGAGDA